MIASHIHDALAQVKTLQGLLLERSFFRGYSGRARLLSALAALSAAALLDSPWVPRTPAAHLRGWGLTLAAALAFNYAALGWWFFFDAEVRRNARRLKPALDAVPALAVGAALSAAVILAGLHRPLFGIWMSLYGLSQAAYRRSLPPGIYWVGLAYVAGGLVCLLAPRLDFLNPWPMGLMFFTGEMIGGIILLRQRHDANTDA
jgi:hypothetical protein